MAVIANTSVAVLVLTGATCSRPCVDRGRPLLNGARLARNTPTDPETVHQGSCARRGNHRWLPHVRQSSWRHAQQRATPGWHDKTRMAGSSCTLFSGHAHTQDVQAQRGARSTLWVSKPQRVPLGIARTQNLASKCRGPAREAATTNRWRRTAARGGRGAGPRTACVRAAITGAARGRAPVHPGPSRTRCRRTWAPGRAATGR